MRSIFRSQRWSARFFAALCSGTIATTIAYADDTGEAILRAAPQKQESQNGNGASRASDQVKQGASGNVNDSGATSFEGLMKLSLEERSGLFQKLPIEEQRTILESLTEAQRIVLLSDIDDCGFMERLKRRAYAKGRIGESDSEAAEKDRQSRFSKWATGLLPGGSTLIDAARANEDRKAIQTGVTDITGQVSYRDVCDMSSEDRSEWLATATSTPVVAQPKREQSFIDRASSILGR